VKTTGLGSEHVVLPCSNALGETPFWSGAEQALYWVDLRAPSLNRLKVAGGEHRIWPMPDVCTGVVPAQSGGVVVALRHTIAHFDPDNETLTHLATIEPKSRGNRLNEARCDPAGRLWVGSMRDYGTEITGALYVVGADLGPRQILNDIRVPNSLCWSPDGQILYFADTAEGHIRRYGFDCKTGKLGEERAPVGSGIAGGADGSTVDVEGYIWNTRYGAGQVVRISPEGVVVEVVMLPVTQPTACTFGDDDLQTLYITTARQRLEIQELARQPFAGHLFKIRLQTPGLPEPAFRFQRREPS
jgi:sugar lactone lactonase YvrE